MGHRETVQVLPQASPTWEGQKKRQEGRNLGDLVDQEKGQHRIRLGVSPALKEPFETGASIRRTEKRREKKKIDAPATGTRSPGRMTVRGQKSFTTAGQRNMT